MSAKIQGLHRIDPAHELPKQCAALDVPEEWAFGVDYGYNQRKEFHLDDAAGRTYLKVFATQVAGTKVFNLIEAAPQLLEAAKKLSAANTAENDDAFWDAMLALEAAIDQAEGRKTP